MTESRLQQTRLGSDLESPLVGAITRIARGWRAVIAAGFAFGAILAADALIRSPKFTSYKVLVPSAPAGASGSQLRGIASQLGLGDPMASGTAPTASPAFLSQLATSDLIINGVLDDTISLANSGQVTIFSLANKAPLFSFGGERPYAVQRANAVREVRRWVAARSDRETGSVRITVRTKWAEVSAGLADAIVNRLNLLNIRVSVERARAEREFVETRLAAQRSSLLAAEGRLQRFLDINREYRSSASLTFEHDRLMREVGLQQELLITLSKSYEDVRIRELQDTPTVSIVEPAVLAARADRRGTAQRAVLGTLAGSLLWCLLLLAASTLDTAALAGSSDAVQLRGWLGKIPLVGRAFRN